MNWSNDPLDLVEELLRDHATGIDVRPRLSDLPPATRDGLVALLDAERALLGDSPPLPPERIGPYVIESFLGQGSQGVVYAARDVRLHRSVALKVLAKSARFVRNAPARLRRFEREARLASRLDHPSICTLYDVGADGDDHYIAMQLVRGGTLADAIDRERKNNFVRAEGTDVHWLDRKLAIAETIARGLHAAHQTGVVHRDIKPSNVLMTETEEPLIADFGLARVFDDDRLTVSNLGTPFGTPAYLAPETIEGDFGGDPLSDIYSLGITLFEWFTGDRPFNGPTRDALYRQILHRAPPSARSLDRSLPRDLDVVLATAMRKERRFRYATAGLLADDLRAVRERRPIEARRATLLRRATSWCRRQPLAASLLLALLAALAGVIHVAVSLRAEAGRTRVALEQSNGLRLLAEARSLTPRDPVAALKSGLAGARSSPGVIAQQVLVDVLWEAIPERILPPTGGELSDLYFLDAETLVMGHRDELFRYSIGTQQRTRLTDSLPQLTPHPIKIDVSPDGNLWIGCGTRVVEWPKDENPREPTLEPSVATSITALRADNDGLFVATTDTKLYRYDRAGRLLWTVSPHDHATTRIALDAAQERIGVVTLDRRAFLLDRETGARVDPLSSWELGITELKFLPDSRTLLVASDDNTASVYDTMTQTSRARFVGHESGLDSVDATADGQWAITASWDRSVRLWDVASHQERRAFRGHSGPVNLCRFSPDGERIATADANGEVRVWRLHDADAILTLAGAAVAPFATTSDGSGLAYTSPHGAVVVRSTLNGSRTTSPDATPPDAWLTPLAMAFSPDATALHGDLALGWSDGSVSLLTLPDLTPTWRHVLDGDPGDAMSLCFVANRNVIAVARSTGEGELLRRVDGAKLHDIPAQAVRFDSVLRPAIVSALHESVIVTRTEGAGEWSLQAIDIASGEILRSERRHSGPISDVGVSPSSELIAACDRSGLLLVWNLTDVSTTPARSIALDRGDLIALAFVDDDQIVVGSGDGDVSIVTLSDGVTTRLSSHDNLVYTLRPNPLRSEIVSASWDQTASLYDVATQTLRLRTTPHGQPLFHSRFLGSSRLLTVDGAGTLRIWPADPVAHASRLAVRFEGSW